MNCPNLFCQLALCGAILTGTERGSYAQGRTPLPLDRVGEGPAPEAVAIDTDSEPDRRTIELTRESRQFLERSTELSSELADQSTSAFQRGLMPLTDYLNQLALGESVELRAADLTEPRGRLEVYRRQVEMLEDAWQRVAWREPGVPGWRSDALLAELAMTDARRQLAEATGDLEAVNALRADSEVLARAHIEQRSLDYQVAFASLPMLAWSARLSVDASLARASNTRAGAVLAQDRQTYLDLVLTRTEAWATMDAGIGRADRVAAARLNRDGVSLGTALAPEPVELTGEMVRQASREFDELFEQQKEYYGYGTASLYDLAQTWVAWHDVHRSAELNSTESVRETDRTRRGAALAELQSLADNVHDLRGRQAADVTFVRLAGQLDELDALYDDVDPQVEYLP